VARARATLGSFQRHVLESSARALEEARENLSASASALSDIDVAAEMTALTKHRILQDVGIAMAAQAAAGSRSVLALLR
jgi:flagellin